MYRKRDLFDPDMLVRHLRGYEPAQSELNRFANDPVRVHFAHGHVAALAGVYDFDLMCGLRRLDAPEAQEPDTLLVAELQLPTTAAYMSGPEKLIAEAYLKSPCGLAPPGSGVAHARPAHPQHLVRGVRAREVEERERRGRTDPPKRVMACAPPAGRPRRRVDDRLPEPPRSHGGHHYMNPALQAARRARSPRRHGATLRSCRRDSD